MRNATLVLPSKVLVGRKMSLKRENVLVCLPELPDPLIPCYLV
jgi:hypothetical protein